jgi:hypothetical protein
MQSENGGAARKKDVVKLGSRKGAKTRKTKL